MNRARYCHNRNVAAFPGFEQDSFTYLEVRDIIMAFRFVLVERVPLAIKSVKIDSYL